VPWINMQEAIRSAFSFGRRRTEVEERLLLPIRCCDHEGGAQGYLHSY
jgi:hypothetical protein